MRWVSTRVLPEPGPASTRMGPAVVVTACFWAGLRVSRKVMGLGEGEFRISNWGFGIGVWRFGIADCEGLIVAESTHFAIRNPRFC